MSQQQSFGNSGGATPPGPSFASNYTDVTFAMSPYTVLSVDNYLSVDSSGGAVTILLPDSTTATREFVIKDRTGNAATNNITVTTVGGAVLLDDQPTYVFDENFESIELLFNGSSYEIF